MTTSGIDLEISRAWLVDPATGRQGPGEIVVRGGILEAVTWLSGTEAEGIGPDGVEVHFLQVEPQVGTGDRNALEEINGFALLPRRDQHGGPRGHLVNT